MRLPAWPRQAAEIAVRELPEDKLKILAFTLAAHICHSRGDYDFALQIEAEIEASEVPVKPRRMRRTQRDSDGIAELKRMWNL